MRRKKESVTNIKRFTSVERKRAGEIMSLVRMGINPLEIKICSGGHSRNLTEKDIRAMYELTGREFDIVL